MSRKGALAVDEVPIPGRDESRNAFKEMVAIYGGPAFVRRARDVEVALDELLQRCRMQREQWLPMVRLRLGTLHALAGDWTVLRPFLATDEDVRDLEQLHEELNPVLRLPV